MTDNERKLGLFGTQFIPTSEKVEYELVADGAEFNRGEEMEDEPGEYSKDTLDLYWHYCHKDE